CRLEDGAQPGEDLGIVVEDQHASVRRAAVGAVFVARRHVAGAERGGTVVEVLEHRLAGRDGPRGRDRSARWVADEEWRTSVHILSTVAAQTPEFSSVLRGHSWRHRLRAPGRACSAALAATCHGMCHWQMWKEPAD